MLKEREIYGYVIWSACYDWVTLSCHTNFLGDSNFVLWCVLVLGYLGICTRGFGTKVIGTPNLQQVLVIQN